MAADGDSVSAAATATPLALAPARAPPGVDPVQMGVALGLAGRWMAELQGDGCADADVLQSLRASVSVLPAHAQRTGGSSAAHSGGLPRDSSSRLCKVRP
eukprot:359648-Chlamydomonas_euryale.AAC.1